MISMDIQALLKTTGLSQAEAAGLFGLGNSEIPALTQELAKLDAKIEMSVIAEIDIFTSRAERDVILIRFITEYDFALYEQELFEHFKCCSVHRAFIARSQRAIERIGGDVTIVFMESNFYETWLSVNDFDDTRDLRIAWARQQIRGLSN